MNRRMPPLAALRAFEAAARHLNFTRAAEELCVTQTAISHHVRQIEDWLQGPVFHRSGRRVALTEAGHRLFEGAREGLDRIAAAATQALDLGDDRRLTLSAPPEVAALWLLPRLQAFRKAHPDLEIRVIADYRRPDFQRDGINAALLTGCGRAGEVSTRLLREDEFVVCSPALLPNLPPRWGLFTAPLLMNEGARHTRLKWRRWMEQLGLDDLEALRAEAAKDPRVNIIDESHIGAGPIYPSFEAMLDACRQGLGFSLVRTSLVAEDLRRGTLVRVFEEALPSDLHLHLVTPGSQSTPGKMSSLADWLIEEGARDEAVLDDVEAH